MAPPPPPDGLAVEVMLGVSLVSTFSSFFYCALSCSSMVIALAAFAPDALILKGPLAPLGTPGGLHFRLSPFLHVGYLIETGLIAYNCTIGCAGAATGLGGAVFFGGAPILGGGPVGLGWAVAGLTGADV